MMIKFTNASLTNGAMMRSCGFEIVGAVHTGRIETRSRRGIDRQHAKWD